MEILEGWCACRYLRNITIPAAFITKSDGQVLKDLFKKTATSPGEDVYIVMDWNDVLPRAQKVSYFLPSLPSLSFYGA